MISEESSVSYMWVCAGIIVIVLTMLAWVRNLATFRFAFIAAMLGLMISVVSIIGYSVSEIVSNGLAPNL